MGCVLYHGRCSTANDGQHTKVRVKLRALELIESWTVSFENDPTFDIVKDSYNYLKCNYKTVLSFVLSISLISVSQP